MKRVIYTICLMLIVGVSGCEVNSNSSTAPWAEINSTEDVQVKPKLSEELTEKEKESMERFGHKYGLATSKETQQKKPEITYSIINCDTFLNYKRSLDVRLNKKVSKATLRAIALMLKAQDSRHYERTFICYYLPGMEVDTGAWATTHFNPNLDVRILGLTIEQENTLKQPDDLSRDVIGSWLLKIPYLGSRVTIFRQGGKLFMENRYTDGSIGKKEIVEKSSGKGRTFQRKGGRSSDDFYIIDNQGDLQIWDSEGYVMTAKRIK